MNYNETADKILHAVGGAENIRMLTHCATRLRMEFNDRAKVNDAQIGTLPGVISVVEKGGQFQIVIGNEVQQVYRRLNKALPEKKGPAGGDKNAKPAGIVARIISVISTTFTPVIPAITGAGMIKALLAILKLTGVISETSSTYQLLNIIADAAFFFLPVLLAYGASLKFECNPILAMTLAGVRRSRCERAAKSPWAARTPRRDRRGRARAAVRARARSASMSSRTRSRSASVRAPAVPGR